MGPLSRSVILFRQAVERAVLASPEDLLANRLGRVGTTKIQRGEHVLDRRG
jgi:hypothetical protein